MENIGFIGLGIMGSRMARNLQKAGYGLTLFNRTKSKAKDLLAQGAKWANSPKEVVLDNNIIITMLSTPEAIREVALGKNGFLKTMSKENVWVNCSTVNPSFAKEMAGEAKEKGIAYVDAPVAGTKEPAEKGELVFLVGGDTEVMAKLKPLIRIMGKKIIPLGNIGQGSHMKMLINLLLAQSMLAFGEAMALGKETGLTEETLFNVLLNVPVTAPFLKAVRPKLENGDYEPNFPLQWMQKDLHLASLTAYELNVAMPSLNIAKEIFAQAKQNGYGAKDFSSIYDYLKINNVNDNL
ncbi:NAD(P)-dependent oxidoreductase [Ulvibacterium marinum]|uniref:NAD(P)-dependent oxidoreductase n=1 Tax=Ulvibacterium marinum TaxID=2419782 RepID=A0A3B0CE63_9FLAO|nr:NAD(P)-dependent oxidoreductase [Ulvibacterium marinum]RKN83311.1 NAD(P)-dependent oxidoreductase [Ulvibacterium marinum]